MEPPTKRAMTDNDKELSDITKVLKDRLDELDKNRVEVQDELRAVCTNLHKQINTMELNINNELMVEYTQKEERLQKALHNLHEYANSSKGDDEEAKKLNEERRLTLFRIAKGELALRHSYELKLRGKDEPFKTNDLGLTRDRRLNVRLEPYLLPWAYRNVGIAEEDDDRHEHEDDNT